MTAAWRWKPYGDESDLPLSSQRCGGMWDRYKRAIMENSGLEQHRGAIINGPKYLSQEVRCSRLLSKLQVATNPQLLPLTCLVSTLYATINLGT